MTEEAAVSSPPRGHEAASLLALSGWSFVLDRILAGVCHDLNGRVSSLLAVTQLIELGEPLPTTFQAEPAKLEAVARFLALIPAYLGAEPNPNRMQDLLSTAMDLHAKVRGMLEEPPPVRFAEDLPPVLVSEGRAVRGLVLLLDHSMRSFPEPDVPVSVAGDPSLVSVTVPMGNADIRDDEALHHLGLLFEMDGAELTVEKEALVLRLPSLSAARSAGR